MAGWQDRFKRVMSLRLDFAQHGCFNVCSNVFAGGLAWLFFLLQQFIDYKQLSNSQHHCAASLKIQTQPHVYRSCGYRQQQRWQHQLTNHADNNKVTKLIAGVWLPTFLCGRFYPLPAHSVNCSPAVACCNSLASHSLHTSGAAPISMWTHKSHSRKMPFECNSSSPCVQQLRVQASVYVSLRVRPTDLKFVAIQLPSMQTMHIPGV